MSLDIGTLVAHLTVDDASFTRSIQQNEQRLDGLRRTVDDTTGRIDRSFRDSTDSVDRLGNSARDTGRDIERTGTQGSRDIDRVGDSARRASQDVGRIGQAAGAAVEGMARVSGAISARAGNTTAGSFISGFADKLGSLASKTGPVAGSILGIAVLGLAAGAALASAIQDGMRAELNRDLFQAQTGITEAQARKFGRAAGESYADAFGESVVGNLDTAKAALAVGLLDPNATQRDAERMINSLDGVAAILGEDIPAVARSAGQAIKTGFAADSQDAFDLMVKGSQLGLNASEDWLDTINEYGIQFQKLGLTGADSIGLMSQAVGAGARDTDIAADALKEFSIRAIDGSDAAAEAYETLGLSAEEMTAKIAQGGDSAREGLGEVLTRLRGIEDPAVRSAAAVGLFGTQAEDLGAALYAMDLDTAARSMNDYEGAAKSAIEVMRGNAATSVEGAMRSIKVAADGLKAALAEAFGPYIQDFADNVSNNRAGVIGFFVDIGNTAFETGKQILGFVAESLHGLADLTDAITGVLVSFLDTVSGMVSVAESVPFLGDALGLEDTKGVLAELTLQTATAGTAMGRNLNSVADGIEQKLLPALDESHRRWNVLGGRQVVSAAFNDEVAKVNKTIADVGITADGSTLQLQNWTGAIDRSIPAQVQMEGNLKGLVTQFREQNRTGLEAGATVEELTRQYSANRDELIQQLIATGMSNKAAVDYANSLGLVPGLVDTQISQPGMPEAKHELDILKGKVLDVPDSKTVHTEALTTEAVSQLESLGYKVETLPDGTVKVTAPTEGAEAQMQAFLQREREMTVWVDIKRRRDAAGVPAGFVGPTIHDAPVRADGAIDEAHIAPGRGAGKVVTSPLGPVRYAEAETGWEAYIPGAPSKRARSTAILSETAKRFGFGLVQMADGGVLDGSAAVAFAQSKDGLPYSYSGASGNDWDCSGYMSGIYNKLTGKSVRFTTDSDFAALGFVPGYDPDGFSIGTNNGSGENGHMAGTLFGVNVESGSSNGVQYGSPALGATDFPSVWHLPGASQMSQEDIDFAIDQALEEANFAPTPQARKAAQEKALNLEMQKQGNPSGIDSGFTDSGIGMSTDGETRVWVTNWPGGLGGGSRTVPAPAPSGGGGGGGGVSYGGTPQGNGPTEQPWATPPTPQERLSEWAQQAGQDTLSAWGLPKPGGFVGALMGPEVAEAGRNIATGATAAAQSWQPGVNITNQVTVSNDQEQLRKLMELNKRLLMQYGGAKS